MSTSAPSGFDVIVIGLGAMGSATVDQLAGRGLRVLGLEAFAAGHANGSSHGPTRIVRRVIEEAPFYVPLVLDAFDRWAELEAESGSELIVHCGAIRIAPPKSDLLDAFRSTADTWNLPYEVLDAAATTDRFPGFRVPDGYQSLFEAGAGFVHAARALSVIRDRATRRGAELHFEEPVTGWIPTGNGVTVTTGAGDYHATSVVITAGAWTARLVADLGIPLVANRVVNVSFEPREPSLFEPGRFVPFIIADDRPDMEGTPALRGDGIYGIPYVTGEGVKVGAGGRPVDPDHVDRVVTEVDTAEIRRWAETYLPEAVGRINSTLTCLYTKTPDEHFVIDVHPTNPNVVIASPCSGHGFKYTPTIGAVLADLATGVAPSFDLSPFALSRFSEGERRGAPR